MEEVEEEGEKEEEDTLSVSCCRNLCFEVLLVNVCFVSSNMEQSQDSSFTVCKEVEELFFAASLHSL